MSSDGIEIAGLTVQRAAAMVRDGAVSSVELVQAVLAAIARRDGRLNAYVHRDEAQALAAAAAADRRRAAGDRAPLLGVPVAIKDVLNVQGQPCQCCSRILAGYVSPYDATAVARLRAAGMVPVGRTNMDEFAMGSTTESSVFGPCRNPWNPACVPGGSSGGSAAAVAGGEAIAALGSDTGGSIRQPAAFCGCVGLKPTYGRVSRYGLTAFASSLDQVGPMTQTVEDAGVLLAAMGGLDPRDSTTLDRPLELPDFRREPDLRGVRLGLPKEFFIAGIEPEVRRLVDAAIRQCEALGAELVEISLPHTDYAIGTYYVIATAEASANLARYDGVRYGFRAAGGADPIDMYGRTRAAGFGAEVKRRIILGTYVLSSGYHDAYYLRAQKVRTLIRRDFENAFARCDAVVTPVTPTAACRLGAKRGDPLSMYLMDIFTVTANLAGVCAVSVPCGLTTERLPVGLQVIGPWFGEARILAIAQAWEAARGPWPLAPAGEAEANP